MATVTGTSWQIDGDGTLVAYPDPFKEVDQDAVVRAEASEQVIIGLKLSIESNFQYLARVLDDFDQKQYYLARGYESMRDWCQSPEIELSWRLVQDLLRIRREVIPVLEQAHGEQAEETLLSAGVSKVRAALPLLSDGRPDDFVELVELSPSMPWNDVRAEVKRLRGTERPLDEPFAVLFKGEITTYEGHATIKVFAIDGVTYEKLGSLRIPLKWLPRFEERFGKLISFSTT